MSFSWWAEAKDLYRVVDLSENIWRGRIAGMEIEE